MTTLLSMCRDVARRTGVDVPTTIVGNEDDVAARLLGAAGRSAKWLAKQHPWRSLRRRHAYTTVNGQADYPFPGDFDRIVPQTSWDQQNYWPMRGAVSQGEWEWWQNAITSGPQGRKIYTFLPGPNGGIQIYPTPTNSTDVLSFAYVSTDWAEMASGVGASEWAGDTYVPRLDVTLLELWIEANFKQSLGMPYLDERSDAEKMLATLKSQDTPGPIMDFDRSPRAISGWEDRALRPPLGGLTGA